MNLNLGCGEQYAEGWINVDFAGCPHRKDQEVDLTRKLPWGKGTIQRAYLGHLLEHLTYNQAFMLLKRLRVCMVSSGQVMIVGPDVGLAQQLKRDGIPLEVPLEQIVRGAGRWKGDVHRWACTQNKLCALLVRSDWVHITPMGISYVPHTWPVAYRHPQWQTAVYAEAPAREAVL